MRTTEVANKLYTIVERDKGKKSYTPHQLARLALDVFREEELDRETAHRAVMELIGSGRVIYTSHGGTSHVEIPSD